MNQANSIDSLKCCQMPEDMTGLAERLSMGLLRMNSTSAPQRNSSPIAQPANPDPVRAVGTTVESVLRFNPVADDLAAAMRAGRRERMDGAFKAIKGVDLAG
jgi:hypothetical protein